MTVGFGKTVELGYFRRVATLAAERGTSGLVGGPRDAVRGSLVASTLSSQRELLPPRGVEAKVLRKTGANANSLIKDASPGVGNLFWATMGEKIRQMWPINTYGGYVENTCGFNVN